MTSSAFSQLKIALVYDRVNTSYGGAEQVLLALHQLFPQAPLFTSVYDAGQAQWAKVFQVKTSFLQHIPGAKSHHRILTPLMPLVFESLDLSGYQIVISITSAEAKGVITQPHQLHICYLLTPSRYLYSHKQEVGAYLTWSKYWPGRELSALIARYLKWWDQVAIHRPEAIIPISKLVQKRVQDFYNLKSQAVIYPPLIPTDKQQTSVADLPGEYYLVVSRLVPYKRIDLAIKACAQLKKHLVIVGEGPQKKKLAHLIKQVEKKKHCPGHIRLLNSVEQPQLNYLFAHCQAVIMPGLEDYGLVALEAQDFGLPVILQQKSGAAEIIHHLQHGIHLKNESLAELIAGLNLLQKSHFDKNKIIKNVRKYHLAGFHDQFLKQLDRLWNQHQNNLAKGGICHT